jgi:hypothetical protein
MTSRPESLKFLGTNLESEQVKEGSYVKDKHNLLTSDVSLDTEYRTCRSGHRSVYSNSLQYRYIYIYLSISPGL